MPDAFLETSALIELVFRNRSVRSKVQEAVPEDARRFTSRYVLFEIARGFLRSLLILYNKALAVQNIRELHEYMHSGQQQFKRYRRETMLSGYEDYLAHLETIGISLTEEQRLAHFRGWLSQHLRRGWRAVSRVADVTNKVGCREDLSAPAPLANHRYDQAIPEGECGIAKACGLDNYISAHRADFEGIKEALAALENPDPESRRRIDALMRLLERSPRSDFAGKDCWSTSDAIICHEAPDGASIVSKNRKHFAPLCKTLRRGLISY